MKKKTLIYLSGALRVTTSKAAETTGARAHVVGVINAYRKLGWEVKEYIAGNKISISNGKLGTQKSLSKDWPKMLAADIVRILLNYKSSAAAWKETGPDADYVYERFAAFQMLGLRFKKAGIPWILETNNPLVYESKSSERKSIALTKLANWFESKAYRQCDVLVCVTEALKKIIVKEIGISPSKILVIPNGVDTDVFNPESYRKYRAFEGFTIGFVGNLYAWAGLDLLVEATHELRNEGKNISIIIIGDGLEKERLKEKVNLLSLEDNIVFTGRIPWEKVPEYIAGFDVAYSGQIKLQIGEMYHSPLKLYEYMSMAKPVIASDFEDARRLISQDNAGFLFQCGNKEDLKTAILKAYDMSEESRADIGQKAREQIVRDHSWENRVKRIILGTNKILESQ